MANVLRLPVMPINGYMISGMLTRAKVREESMFAKLSEVKGGEAVYPPSMVAELEMNVGDFWIDCSRMPAARN